MKKRKIFAVLLIFVQVIGQNAFAAKAGTIPAAEGAVGSPWGEEYAQELDEHGYWKGTERGYELEREVTRAEALTMIYRVCGISPEPGGGVQNPFSDVPEQHWARDTILYAYGQGHIAGVSETVFAPDRTVRAREFFKILLTVKGFEDVTLENVSRKMREDAVFEKHLRENVFMEALLQGDYLLTRNGVVDICYILVKEQWSGHLAYRFNRSMKQEGNYVISPYSLENAMMMAASGAAGQTRQQILDAFSVGDLATYQQEQQKRNEAYQNNQTISLQNANSIWLNTDALKGRFDETYQKDMEAYFDGVAQAMPGKEAVERINAWVAEKTEDQITGIVNESNFTLALVNALHFSGRWKNPFGEPSIDRFYNQCVDQDGTGPFRTPATYSEIEFMSAWGSYDYYEGEYGKMVGIPYEDEGLALYLMNTAESVDMEQLLPSMEQKELMLTIPCIQIETEGNMTGLLMDMGITECFSLTADFSRMLKEKIHISKVFQKAVFEMDNNGTRASAGTAVMTSPGASLQTARRETLVFNRPFTFMLYDTKNQKALFTGKYVCGPDPKPLNHTFEGLGVGGKPVIYLYPEQEQEIDVSLELDGEFLFTYPLYENGWHVTAKPDGTILSGGREYSYLFWEGTLPRFEPDYREGFVVSREDTVAFLQDTLSKMGLTPREYNEFITYWAPKMQENDYNKIYFAGEEYEEAARLNIEPKPDSILRVFMVWEACSGETWLKPQPIEPFERKGFTVVEWGGLQKDR